MNKIVAPHPLRINPGRSVWGINVWSELKFRFVSPVAELSINKNVATKKKLELRGNLQKHLLELRFAGQGQKPWGGVKTLSGESGRFQSTQAWIGSGAGYLF